MVRMRYLLLIIVLLIGCSYFEPTDPNLASYCHYEASKYADQSKDYFRWSSLYHQCLTQKGGDVIWKNGCE